MPEELALVCGAGNKRPEKTPAMRREAAAILVKEMVQAGMVPAYDADSSVNDIVKATRYETDGYRIARELEQSCRWDCDMEIAEKMDEFDGALESIYRAAEKRWAAENPSIPAFGDRDEVIWRGKPALVCGIYDGRPHTYKVQQGEMGDPKSFYIVPFEDVRPATEQ